MHAVSFLVLFAAVALLNASGAHCKHYFSRKEGAPSTNVVYGRACNATGPFTDRDYIVVSNFPNPESNEELLVAARSRVRFTEVFENLYTGKPFPTTDTLVKATVSFFSDWIREFDIGGHDPKRSSRLVGYVRSRDVRAVWIWI